MTFEEAYSAAAGLLEQRGQLMNGHLLRLVEADKVLFSQVRDALIREGVAEDRSGVGLAAMQVITVVKSEGQGDSELPEKTRTGLETRPTEDLDTEWWLLVSGVIQGPIEYEALCQMHRLGEIAPGDVIRQGERGLWQRPPEVLRFDHAEKRPTGTGGSSVLDSSKSDVFSTGATAHQAPYYPPDKIWSRGEQIGPSRLRQGWDLLAHFCGGSTRLSIGLFTLAAIGLFMLWWQQPPPAETIYKEFTDCYSTLQKLRERRIGRSEWAPSVTRFRPRVQSILTRLQFRTAPVQKELYMAGTLGLIPLLDIPRDPTNAERVFDKHIRTARAMIDHADQQASSTGK
jgi:hypothetical protein